MIENYKVSVCVPVYNVDSYIERCARSLFEQTYDNLEFVFVNDCTPDKSIECLQNVIKEYPQRKEQVRIINHKENGGLAKARNTAVDESTGVFIIHVDSDDYVDIYMVSCLVSKQKEGNYDIVSADSLDVYKSYKVRYNQPFFKSSVDMTVKLLDKSVRGSIWARLIRKSLYIDNKIFAEEGLNNGEDCLVMPQLAYNSKLVAIVSLPLYYYNQTNESSYTNIFSEKTAEQVWLVYERLLFMFSSKDDIYISAIRKARAKILVSNIICCLRHNGSNKYCKLLLDRLCLCKTEYAYISLPYRPICYIRNIGVLLVYIRISYMVRHFFLFLKNGFFKKERNRF